MEQNLVFDQLTIEEYVHHSSVLSAGLSRTDSERNAYISMIRDPKSIPLIMQSIEKDNKAASNLLKLKLSLIHNVLVVFAPAFTGSSLKAYAQTLQPYATFDLLEKILANLTRYETLDSPIFMQVLHPDKYVVDSNGMPHIQFWIDDLMIFNNNNQTSLEFKQTYYQKFAHLLRTCFSTDFVPKQLDTFVNLVEQGHYTTCLDMLNGLQEARQAYYDSDSERKGEVLIKGVWAKMQKRMLLIVFLLIALVYGLYWYYFSRPNVSTDVYKTRIGDVAFVIENVAGKQEIESQTYVLIFPQPPENTDIQTQPTSNTTNQTSNSEVEPSQNIIVEPGQNLFRICLDYYGDGNYYQALAKYNNIENPDLIPVGLSIELPPINKLIEFE